ncbi:MAG: hypothetical protein QME81_12185 [bacterium]|nr:hypothetical protein [bacterium]
MGIMEKMAGAMMGRMSGQEKEMMMEGMMDNFFSGMSQEEKQEMMTKMMPKMMGEMMGNGGIMEMMKMCCGGEGEEGFNPMEMCASMMESVSRSCELATYATPEVRGLFEDWTEEVSSEILQFVRERERTTPEEIASKMKISKNSAIFFISHLARQDKLKIESVMTTKEVNKNG